MLARTVSASGSALMQKHEQLVQGQRLHLLNLQESSLQDQNMGCRREQLCRRCMTHPCVWSHHFINTLHVYVISKELRTLSFHGRQCPKSYPRLLPSAIYYCLPKFGHGNLESPPKREKTWHCWNLVCKSLLEL